eukprot:TRINITY_DN13594_c0_g1_i4.p1 TRINITY_DN13594_c0_g1~~TRINITY_DN13594_c0_g1_i4.p1  ORF type:complete len:298 (+),score=68.79 TRINITY_DN13594_c0_g1_i4:11-904(+)
MAKTTNPSISNGILVLASGFLIHLVLGTFYLWGGINVYIASYLRMEDPTAGITLSLTSSIFPFMGIFINIGLIIGVDLAENFGFRPVSFVCTALMSAVIFLASFVKTFWLFTLLYGILFGLCSGVFYMLPIYIGWNHFPKKRGLVSGSIIAGFGLSTFIFNFIALQIVNPDNQKPGKKVFSGENVEYYFQDEIASKVPSMLQTLSVCYLILGAIGSICMRPPLKKNPLLSIPDGRSISMSSVVQGPNDIDDEIERRSNVDNSMMEETPEKWEVRMTIDMTKSGVVSTQSTWGSLDWS